MDVFISSMCLLFLVSWNTHPCDGFSLSVAKTSCGEEGEASNDSKPLTLHNIFNNISYIKSINDVLTNGDTVRISGLAEFMPPFIYYGCFYHQVSGNSETYFAFLTTFELESNRPMYDCFQKCYGVYDGHFYAALGYGLCICTASIANITLLLNPAEPDKTCEKNFENVFNGIYKPSNPFNIMAFKIGRSSSYPRNDTFKNEEPYLKLFSFAVADESGTVDYEYGLSFDNVTDIVCTSSNTKPTDTNETISFFKISQKTPNISLAHSICLQNGMILASRDTDTVRFNSNGVHLLGDFSYLSIYDSNHSSDNACVVLEKRLGNVFIKQDNCSFLRPFLCVTDTNVENVPNEEEDWSIKYVYYALASVLVVIVCSVLVITYIYRRNMNCNMCLQRRSTSNPTLGQGHYNNLSVPGRLNAAHVTGQMDAGSVPGMTNTDVNCVLGRLNATRRNITAGVSSDGAVPGRNNMAKFCPETSAKESDGKHVFINITDI